MTFKPFCLGINHLLLGFCLRLRLLSWSILTNYRVIKGNKSRDLRKSGISPHFNFKCNHPIHVGLFIKD